MGSGSNESRGEREISFPQLVGLNWWLGDPNRVNGKLPLATNVELGAFRPCSGLSALACRAFASTHIMQGLSQPGSEFLLNPGLTLQGIDPNCPSLVFSLQDEEVSANLVRVCVYHPTCPAAPCFPVFRVGVSLHILGKQGELVFP